MSEREKWLNGYCREWDRIMVYPQICCTGCGKSLGVVCYVPGDEAEIPNPDWPFDKETCPICDLREQKWKLMEQIREGPEDKLTARLMALRNR